MNIRISLPIRSVANAIAKPFVATAKFVGRGINAAFQFAARGLASASRLVAKTPVTIRHGASVSAHFIAQNVSTAVAAVKTGVVALGSAATTFVTTVAVGAWGYAQYGFAVLYAAVGNVINATVTPAIVWALGSKAAGFGIALGSVLQWVAVIALPIVILGSLWATATNVSAARRVAAARVSTVSTETGVAHEYVAADGPDPDGSLVHPDSNIVWDSQQDEDEAAQTAAFLAAAQAVLDELLPEMFTSNNVSNKIGSDYATALPATDSADDYHQAGVLLSEWVTANTSIARRRGSVMSGYNKAVREIKGQAAVLSLA